MNEAKIARFLAEFLWDEHDKENPKYPSFTQNGDEIIVWYPMKIHTGWFFDPIHRVEHAFMVVEKMEGWTFDLSLDGSWDCVLHKYPKLARSEADTPAKAISIAAVCALATDAQIQEMEL